jgi:carbonic anhydrase
MYKLMAILLLFVCVKADAKTPPSPSEELNNLMEGNKRFVSGKFTHPYLSKEAKETMAKSQAPFAAIIGCSDSRVPPELLFDCGLGELFVVRDAGNVVGPIELDSVEFAVATLKVPLVIVLGHQNCGAVKATLQGQDNVPELENIFPLIDEAFQNCDESPPDTLVDAIICNVKNSVEIVKTSPTIAPILAKNKVKIIGAYFEIATGKVCLITD